MSRKTLIIIAIIFGILIIGLFAAAFFLSREPSTGGEKKSLGEVLRELSPFGGSAEERELEEREGFELGPDGTPIGPDGEPVSGAGDTVVGAPVLSLRQLTVVPVAGAYASSSDTRTEVRYIERQTGHIYQIDMESSRRNRLSNTTIPAIREAVWNEDGSKVIVRYLDDNDVIKSFWGSLESSVAGGEGELGGSFLIDDITHIARSPAGARFFTLAPFGNNAIGTIVNFTAESNEINGKKEILNSPFTEWLPAWPADMTLALTAKASGEAEGFLYFLDTKTERMTKVLGGINGLTTNVSPDLKYILFSESGDNTFKTKLYTVEIRTSSDFPLVTLPEKCVWGRASAAMLYCAAPEEIPSGLYPDVWYQGLVSFSDVVWKIDVETGAVEILAVPRDTARQEVDIVNPFLDEEERFLIFMNKKDGTLWSLKIAD